MLRCPPAFSDGSGAFCCADKRRILIFQMIFFPFFTKKAYKTLVFFYEMIYN